MVCPRCCGTGALPAEVAVLPASRRVTLLRTAAAPLQPLAGAQPSQALVLRHVVCEGLGRRGVVSLGPLLLLGGASRAAASAEQLQGDPPSSPAGVGGPPLPLVTYRDEGGRFSLERPAAWVAVDKAGATVLFQDPQSKLSTLGVTLSPVTITSLRQFGTLQEVTDKLVKAERDKDGTLRVDVLETSERVTPSGAPLYEMSYFVEHATRGCKTVLNAVCVDARVLYIYALQFKVGTAEKPLPAQPVAAVASRLVSSFAPGGP